LIVRAASRLLSNWGYHDVEGLHHEASLMALEWAKEIGLPAQALDATLLTAHCHEDKLIIGASGDGVIIIELLTGTLEVYSISFPSGFPLYPIYAHQPERLLAWKTNQHAYREIRHFRKHLDSLESIKTTTTTSLTETIRLNTSDVKQVALISDGVHSFYKNEDSPTSRHATSISMEQVLRELLAFKGGHGSFVARRVKRFARQCELTSWHHADDLAIGALHFGD
jgi:hypothetical protein